MIFLFLSEQYRHSWVIFHVGSTSVVLLNMAFLSLHHLFTARCSFFCFEGFHTQMFRDSGVFAVAQPRQAEKSSEEGHPGTQCWS